MTDRELKKWNQEAEDRIIKALECSVNGKCPECPYFHSYPCDKCRNMRKDALDLINRLQAEVERLTIRLRKVEHQLDDLCKMHHIIKSEAYKEFAENVQGEIDDAIHSNYNAKEERVTKSKKFGIPIGAEDSYLMYCDGKIHALSGINYYIDNLLKEMEGAENGENKQTY